jgi:hypothetical protein
MKQNEHMTPEAGRGACAPARRARRGDEFRRRACLLLLGVLVGTASSRGEEFIWTGAQSSAWSEAANWNNSKMPEGTGAIVHFPDAASERTVQLEDAVTVAEILFNGRTPTDYSLGGGTLVFKDGGERRLRLDDTSGGENSVNSDIIVSHDARKMLVIGVARNTGTLTLGGKIKMATPVTIDVRNGASVVVTGDLAIEPETTEKEANWFNLTMQTVNQSRITISGEGRSSSAPGTSAAIILGDSPQAEAGAVMLSRPAALSADLIYLGSNTSQADAAVGLGADHAIENTEGTFRVQVQNEGNTVRLNLNGHSLDLSEKQLSLFTFGVPGTFVIDMGGGNASLKFAASSNVPWKGKLAIINFQKGSHQIQFGEDDSSLKAEQLALITINDGDGVTLDGQGRLVAPNVR